MVLDTAYAVDVRTWSAMMNRPIVLVLSLTGLIMGLITSLVGIAAIEAYVWTVFYVAWVVIVTQRGVEKPFVTIMAASMIGAVLTGVSQMLLFESYMANNPAYAEQMADAKSWQTVPVALVMGAVFGAVFGGIAAGIRKFRS
ncbi:MAG: hypothetical protein ACJAYU_000697 [Bradymonadia bacterium]|jgi:hypothetical protein